MIWSVPRAWAGETCAILAGGPSLQGFDPIVLAGLRCITINDSWRIHPRADIHYFADTKWYRDQERLNRWTVDRSEQFYKRQFKGFWVKGCVSEDGFGEHPMVRTLRYSGQIGLEKDPSALRHGSNSGYAAINLAYHFGVSRILLLGYDMHVQGARTHWHDEERPQLQEFVNTLERSFLPLFQFLVEPLRHERVEVINCTPDSALKCWPFMPLEQIVDSPTVGHGTRFFIDGVQISSLKDL